MTVSSVFFVGHRINRLLQKYENKKKFGVSHCLNKKNNNNWIKKENINGVD